MVRETKVQGKGNTKVTVPVSRRNLSVIHFEGGGGWAGSHSMFPKGHMNTLAGVKFHGSGS